MNERRIKVRVEIYGPGKGNITKAYTFSVMLGENCWSSEIYYNAFSKRSYPKQRFKDYPPTFYINNSRVSKFLKEERKKIGEYMFTVSPKFLIEYCYGVRFKEELMSIGGER